MQKIAFLFLFLFLAAISFSQQAFFVYIQADNHQSFYAKINTRIYSSTESGYMIIPKLGDSVYEVVIGFAKNIFPEQSFSIPINKNDQGYQLKNFGEKGWALINLQNASVIKNAGLPVNTVSEFSGIRKTDAFSEMLASVVNDTAILYTAVSAKSAQTASDTKSPVITDPVEKRIQDVDSIKTTVVSNQPQNPTPIDQSGSALKPDTGSGSKAGHTEPPAKINPVGIVPDTSKVIDSGLTKKVITEPLTKTGALMTDHDSGKTSDSVVTKKVTSDKPFITKIEEKQSGGMYEAVYLEQYNFNTDTIKLTIPLNDNINGNATPVTSIAEKKGEPFREQGKVTDERPVAVDTAASVKKAVQIINSDCKDLATDYDVDKLRVKILSNETVDDKLSTAKKYLKTKCLTVKQVRALTELFPSDETKYRFFDLSYPFVSDTYNFYLLEDLIENNYYKNRFKAMIQK